MVAPSDVMQTFDSNLFRLEYQRQVISPRDVKVRTFKSQLDDSHKIWITWNPMPTYLRTVAISFVAICFWVALRRVDMDPGVRIFFLVALTLIAVASVLIQVAILRLWIFHGGITLSVASDGVVSTHIGETVNVSMTDWSLRIVNFGKRVRFKGNDFQSSDYSVSALFLIGTAIDTSEIVAVCIVCGGSDFKTLKSSLDALLRDELRLQSSG